MPVRFSFATSNRDARGNRFEVVHFEGVERLSSLYRFQIQLASEDPNVNLGDLVGTDATLTIERDENAHPGAPPRRFHGIVSEAAVTGASHGADQKFFYEVTLVPRLWLFTQSRGHRVYATDRPKTVFEVVETVLTDDALSPLTPDEDFELRNLEEEAYGKRDYVSQFDETYFDFMSRIMEHVGLFYFFEQGAEREKLIIGDRKVAFRDIHCGHTRIHYQGDVPRGGNSPQSIHRFSGRRRHLPKTMILNDYEYDLNDPNITRQRAIAPVGGPLSDGPNHAHGVVAHFGDFGKPFANSPETVRGSDDSGAKAKDRLGRLLDIRVEEVAARQIVFEGGSDREDLFPGGHFEMCHHFRDDMNSTYLVTEVRHRGSSPTYGLSGLPGAEDARAGYANEFTAIYSETPFRPERRTPKPKLQGMMPATVDVQPGRRDDKRAQVDALGRYKVRLPFDARLDDLEAGKASSYVRMATPSAGAKQGMHFPLLPGAEVIWSCINGDIDRPVICGAIPNRAAPSNVKWENRNQSRIDTPGGVKVVLIDGSR